jgi:hypothetical protein
VRLRVGASGGGSGGAAAAGQLAVRGHDGGQRGPGRDKGDLPARHAAPLREAVTRALSATGTTITSAGLVLAGTFIVFGIVAGGGSGGSQFRDIAIGLALGILMDTFLVRTLLVPSTVVLLGRWNWWPSKMSRISAELPAGTADPVPAAPASDHTAGEVAGGATGSKQPDPRH